MSQENVQKVQDAYEAFAKGDAQPLVALMHPDIVWVEPDGSPGVGDLTEGSGVYRGRDNVLNGVFAKLPGLYDDLEVNAEQYLDAGDHVVALGTVRAKVPGTGAPLTTPFAHIWKLEAGMLVWWRSYEDTALLHHARGAL